MPTATQPRLKRATAKRKRTRPRTARKPLRMSTPADQRTLIDEIDERQDVLLNELASLNARVEALLNDCLATREQQRVAEEEEAEPASTVGELVS